MAKFTDSKLFFILLTYSATLSAEGVKPYTPTAIEWVEVYAEAACSNKIDFPIITFSSDGLNTLVMFVSVGKTNNAALAVKQIEQSERCVNQLKNQKGWSWLKIDKRLN